jgi:hypothetical protein
VKQSILVLLVLMAGVSWLFFRPKLVMFMARLGLALRVATVVYFILLAWRLVAGGIDQEQLEIAIISLLFFGGLWGLAWLVTRSMAKSR